MRYPALGAMLKAPLLIFRIVSTLLEKKTAPLLLANPIQYITKNLGSDEVEYSNLCKYQFSKLESTPQN